MYVLLEFDDDKEAEALIKSTQEDGKVGVEPRLPDGRDWVGAQVRAKFKKPTQFCQCTDEERKPFLGKSARGQRFGWWVCGKCRKPREGMAQHYYNLLELDVEPWKRLFSLYTGTVY